MEQLTALVVGALTAAAVYLMLSRTLVRFLFGLVLISNAANLVIFASGRMTFGAPPLIDEGADAPPALVANALPQALVLTAIVIGFGLFAFALALVFRAYTELGTADSDEMRLAEPVEPAGAAPAAKAEDPHRPGSDRRELEAAE
jgi:multicomponent Na+:H+ antiporter subunit C